MDAQTLTASQLRGFSITGRACSVFSLLGSILVIGTFCTSKSFHKPINRLVFYASFGNMMTNVATLIARSYIESPQSAGCQFQAFLIQMFMPADAFWTLAMAINVYLTFYRKFDAQKLRRMEIPYLIVCYGVPFVVAIAYVFVDDSRRGRMYGNATLWCWVSPSWDVWRIATFYGPVWVIILVTFFIYIRAGREIYQKHKLLRNFQYSSQHEPEPLPPTEGLYSASKTTEVVVTTEIINRHQQGQQDIDLAPLGRRRTSVVIAGDSMAAAAAAGGRTGRAGRAGHLQRPEVNSAGERAAACFVIISSDSRAEVAAMGDGSKTADNAFDSRARSLSLIPSEVDATVGAIATTTTTTATAATAATIRNPASQRMRRRAAYEANSAAWSYAKCALLFFTALLVTWIPSSANRVFSVVHVDRVSVPLEYMSAFVLPLQGFWNAIIYFVTSWKAVCTLWDEVIVEAWSSDWQSPWWVRRRPHLQAQQQQQQQHQQQQASIHSQTRGDANAVQLKPPGSRDSDEMLVQTVGRQYTGGGVSDGVSDSSTCGRGRPGTRIPTSRSRSGESYESESVKEFAIVRTRSRDS